MNRHVQTAPAAQPFGAMSITQRAAAGGTRRLPPHAYFVVSAVFHYLGPSFAVLLFARVDVLGVAWLRIASAAAIFALWRRPWRAYRAAGPDARRLILGMGVVLAVMNACFYEAIGRLPLGTVAAIEFLPVIALAALGARTARNAGALALAVTGVYLLTDVRLAGAPLGVAFAFADAALFAAYVVLADRVAKHPGLDGVNGLAGAMLVALVVITPLGGRQVAPAAVDPVALAAGLGVGVASSVIPYVADQLALVRLPRATYALMVSLLPATATVIGVAVLRQIPGTAELAGVALVVAGVALHRERPTGGARRRTEAICGSSPMPAGGADAMIGAAPRRIPCSHVALCGSSPSCSLPPPPSPR